MDFKILFSFCFCIFRIYLSGEPSAQVYDYVEVVFALKILLDGMFADLWGATSGFRLAA
jgi:hypothetical protein